MNEHERPTANGMNGYLADGTRVQVPDWCRHSPYEVHELPQMSWRLWDTDPNALVQMTAYQLHRLHCLIPRDVLGPVEGDGSWFDDDLTGGRIITLWVERGGAMWDRLHRKDRVAA